MADISGFTSLIENSKRGETVRDSIINSLKTMDRDGISAETLNGNPASIFALLADVNYALMNNRYDNSPIYEKRLVRGSTKGVESNGVYWVYKRLADDLDRLLGE